MENNNNNNSSSSHGAGVVALPGCFAPRLNAEGSTCDQTYTRASPAAVVVAGASSPQAPAQQHSATCKLDGCSDAAVFVFEGDALGSYCEVHKPIIEQVEAEAGTQVSCVRRDFRRGKNHENIRSRIICIESNVRYSSTRNVHTILLITVSSPAVGGWRLYTQTSRLH